MEQLIRITRQNIYIKTIRNNHQIEDQLTDEQSIVYWQTYGQLVETRSGIYWHHNCHSA